jgi:hypothetical protein
MNHIFTTSLLCRGVLLAGEFWQSKKPSEWTEKEARKIVENSPWVKEVQPAMNMQGMGGMGGGGDMGPGPGGGVMLFAFPRKELQITPEDKQVTFKTTMGPMEISVKFNLKEIAFDQKLAL